MSRLKHFTQIWFCARYLHKLDHQRLQKYTESNLKTLYGKKSGNILNTKYIEVTPKTFEYFSAIQISFIYPVFCSKSGHNDINMTPSVHL